MINEVTDKWESREKKYKDKNFNKKEWQALKTIQKEKSIIVKKADKGGATVVLDKSQYLGEAEKQPAEETVY